MSELCRPAGCIVHARRRIRGASTERKAVLSTIAFLLIGCFVAFVAVLALAFVTDGRRISSMVPARAGAPSRRPGRRP
jgi:hypothetical protein